MIKILNLNALNKIEKDRLKCFINKHKKHTLTSDGSNFVFEIIPCSLGETVIVKCICGEEKNITDYSHW